MLIGVWGGEGVSEGGGGAGVSGGGRDAKLGRGTLGTGPSRDPPVPGLGTVGRGPTFGLGDTGG